MALMSELGQEMPFWDRSIDLVVMTHADADHITGLVEVLRRYQVGGWLDNGRAEARQFMRNARRNLESGSQRRPGRSQTRPG